MRARLFVASWLVSTCLACSNGSSGAENASAPAAGGSGGAAGSGDAGAGGASGGGGASSAPPEWDRVVTPLPAAAAEQQRAACAFGPGALPAETLGDGATYGAAIPIDHVVLVMLENRSFDHMLQRLPDVGVGDVDVAPAGFANPSGAGASVAIHPISDGSYCLNDLEHGWSKVHQEVGTGAMQGFVMANETSGDGARAMTYQTPDTAPLAYFLGRNAAISDRYFCALQGPTWPNRMYFYAATSLGLTSNTLSDATATTIFEQLDQRAVDWRVYKANSPGAAMFVNTFLNHKDRFVALSKLAEDAAAGTLPAVSYVDPELQGNSARQSSQHPPANHQFGEQFVWDVLSAVSSGPAWARTAVFVTYDEHGGFYDHVTPPKACPPDDLTPLQGADLGAFDHYGVRVPVYVVSPYAKKGHVSHVTHDHTSIVRFIETRFKLPALTRRDANADAMLDLFDFQTPPDTAPLALPPRPTIDAAQDAACKQAFPK